MTKIIGGFRKSGKTTELIKMAHEQDLVIVTFSKARAKQIFEQSVQMKMRVRFPAIVADFPLGKHATDVDVVIDDVENVLFNLIGRPIKAISSSFKLEKKERSFTLIEMLQGKAPQGIYRINVSNFDSGDNWHGVLVELVGKTASGGYGIKMKTDPNDPSRTNIRKGHLLPLCGIMSSEDTRYILVEEKK